MEEPLPAPGHHAHCGEQLEIHQTNFKELCREKVRQDYSRSLKKSFAQVLVR